MNFAKKEFGFRQFGYIFSGLAILFLIIAIILFIKRKQFLNESILSTGKIVGVEKNQSRDSHGNVDTYNHLVFQFIDLKGRTVEFTNSTSSNGGFIQNEEINVRYIPNDTKGAIIDDWSSKWFGTLIMSIFFEFFGMFGVAFIFIKT